MVLSFLCYNVITATPVLNFHLHLNLRFYGERECFTGISYTDTLYILPAMKAKRMAPQSYSKAK
jgi:hypothetical protein